MPFARTRTGLQLAAVWRAIAAGTRRSAAPGSMTRQVAFAWLAWLVGAAPALAGVGLGERLQAELDERVAAFLEQATCAEVETRTTDDQLRLIGFVDSSAALAALERAVGTVVARDLITIDVEVHPWPHCELLAVIAPYRGATSEEQLDLRLEAPGGATTLTGPASLADGDPLVLRVTVPRRARFLYLGYVLQDHTVAYLTTVLVKKEAAGDRQVRVDSGYEIGPPFGAEMLVAVTTESALFAEARPAFEPAADYLAALRARLAELAAAHPDETIATASLALTTGPRGASSTSDQTKG